MKDYYKVLEISKTATKAEIKTAYRKLAKRYHPDRNSDSKEAEAKFKEIVEAYGVLSNTFKRKAYERIQYTSAKRKSKSTGVKQTKAYNKSREDEFLNRFYISMFPWVAKASIIFIIYGLIFSLDYFLPRNQSTENIITIVEYNTNNPDGGIIPIGGNLPLFYFESENEKNIEFFVKTEKHNFLTKNDILSAAKPNIPVSLKSSIIFNSVQSITIANYNRDITIVPKLYGYPLLFPFIFVLGCIVVFIGITTKLSVETIMLMFIVNCIATFISFFMVFLEIHVRFYI